MAYENKRDVIMFCGKGGVGKTTCAAATALHYANSGKKTLVISTDFTPSLQDIFELKTSGTPSQVADNLYLEEISYDAIKALWDKRFGPEVYDIFSTFVDIGYVEFTDFITSILPGLRDEFMVDYIKDLSESGNYEKIIWDTAPAGQTLGLLRMPAIVNEHLKAAPRIYTTLKATKQRKRSVLSVIKDWQQLSDYDMQFLKTKVEFNLVTIAEALAVQQIDGLLAEFGSYGLFMNHVMINNVIETQDSPFLVSKASVQSSYLSELESKFPMNSTRIGLLPYEVKGKERLLEIEKRVFAGSVS